MSKSVPSSVAASVSGKKDIIDLKGDLEVIVNYMDLGLMKVRTKDVKDAEMPYVLRDLFLRIMEEILRAKSGKLPKNAFPVFSDEQFRKI